MFHSRGESVSKKSYFSIALIFVGVVALFAGLRGTRQETSEVYTKLGALQHFDLNQVKGSYFILHFWAKWCEPCAEEIPHLVEFASKANFGKPLKVLAVSLDPNLEDSKEILPEKGAHLPGNFILVLDADHQVAEKMGSFQYPETYFIGPEGQILEKWIGAQKWQKPEVLEFFKQKLL